MICRIMHIPQNKHKCYGFSAAPATAQKKTKNAPPQWRCLHAYMHDIFSACMLTGKFMCNSVAPDWEDARPLLSLCRAMFQDSTIDAAACGVWDFFFGKAGWRRCALLWRHGVHAVAVGVKRDSRGVCPSSVPWICMCGLFRGLWRA
jgi:hypothetical protein